MRQTENVSLTESCKYLKRCLTGTRPACPRWMYPGFELCWSVLDGLRVGLPCEPTGYLRAFYGPDWASPPPAGEWNYRTGHPNVIENGHWPEHSRHEVFQSFEV